MLNRLLDLTSDTPAPGTCVKERSKPDLAEQLRKVPMSENEPTSDNTDGARVKRRRTQKVAESVARAILHDISDRGLPPGSRLPPEAEMLETYDVARASLREALRILEIYGMITIKPGPGGGPVVAAIDSQDLGQTLTFFLQASGTTFREVMQARLILEPIMARQAAERGDVELNQVLRACIDQSRGVLDEGDEEYLSVATGFHEVILGASGNAVLDLLARSLKEIYVARVRTVVYQPDEREKLLHDHEVVADAIVSGDGALAERLMREHMVEYVSFLEERFPGFMDERIDWF
ncbi:MAG: FadR/GntR family transcriptional regulator [Acidimicrobiales bacterium]